MTRRVFSLLFLALLALPAVAGALGTGEVAPDFAGMSTKGRVQLSDFKGEKHVVVALYFAAFTPV